jgi:predicted dehydrogenase
MCCVRFYNKELYESPQSSFSHMKNILIIGFGPHAKKIYYQILKKNNSKYSFAILDIKQGENNIQQFFKDKECTPKAIHIIEQFRAGKSKLPTHIQKILASIQTQYRIDGMIISCESEYHLPYANWAIQKKISILMDKPISVRKNCSTNIRQSRALLKEYTHTLKRYNKVKEHMLFSVVTQRRYHPGFKIILEKIQEITKRTQCPITFANILHADGQWRLPSELIDIKYHSFDRGYGKGAHSGYHIFDILCYFLTNQGLESNPVHTMEVFANAIRPKDFLEQIPFKVYNKVFSLFKEKNTYDQKKIHSRTKTHGELDLFANIAFKSKNKATITSCTLNLLHTSFSQRGTLQPNSDLYRGNGRVRNETYCFQQGPFQAIHIVSLQSAKKTKDPQNPFEIGGDSNFDIHIFRNDQALPGVQRYEKISLRDITNDKKTSPKSSHLDSAREQATTEFLDYLEKKEITRTSDYASHHNSVMLMSKIYESLARQFLHKPSVVRGRFKTH